MDSQNLEITSVSNDQSETHVPAKKEDGRHSIYYHSLILDFSCAGLHPLFRQHKKKIYKLFSLVVHAEKESDNEYISIKDYLEKEIPSLTDDVRSRILHIFHNNLDCDDENGDTDQNDGDDNILPRLSRRVIDKRRKLKRIQSSINGEEKDLGVDAMYFSDFTEEQKIILACILRSITKKNVPNTTFPADTKDNIVFYNENNASDVDPNIISPAYRFKLSTLKDLITAYSHKLLTRSTKGVSQSRFSRLQLLILLIEYEKNPHTPSFQKASEYQNNKTYPLGSYAEGSIKQAILFIKNTLHPKST